MTMSRRRDDEPTDVRVMKETASAYASATSAQLRELRKRLKRASISDPPVPAEEEIQESDTAAEKTP
ncbi:MAG: hypothetical protein HC882_06090 [Acidobacteria bacterium]|nr:hypothetical protein [Acidobacteriota bacterium]